MGGDEFVVLMPDLKDISAVQVLRRTPDPHRQPSPTPSRNRRSAHRERRLLRLPRLAGSIDNLLERTDSAMHDAKRSGRNRYQVFTADMLQDTSPRLSMESALRLALDNQELFLHYQPQVALPSGRVIGMEALLRWKHPDARTDLAGALHSHG